MATQGIVDRRVREISEGKIHWQTPTLIAVLFIGGLLGPVGHHVFYTKLHGQAATDELKMIRYGTALAFFVKATLVGCVILCYRQRIWYTFRRKALTSRAIDGMFGATEDLSHFFKWEMLKAGKLTAFMAACSCKFLPCLA